jgi:hypothetical protein
MGAYEGYPVYFVDSAIVDTNVASATPDFTAYNPITFSVTTGVQSVYKTIADINACTFAAGDTILQRCGQEWREQLTVPSSGSAGLPITFGKYGSGADPIITGGDLVGTWTAATVTVTATINAIGDDATYDPLVDWYYDSISTILGYISYPQNFTSGYVFEGLNVAKSTSITSAKVTFITNASESDTPVNLKIYAEAADTTSAFSSKTNFSSRYTNGTTAVVPWADVGAWTANNSYDTPEIKTVIQEIVNRAGWVSGNNLTIYVGFDTGCLGRRDAYGRYSGNTSYLPVLSVTIPSTTVWQVALTTEPKIVLFDGVVGQKKANAGLCVNPRDWYWAANVLYCYSATDPDSAYVTPGIETPIRNNAVEIDAERHHVTFDGLTLRLAKTDNFYMHYPTVTVDQSHVTFQNCTIEYATLSGLYINASNPSSFVVSNNIIRYNGTNGVFAQTYGTGSGMIIQNNTVYSNAWNLGVVESAGIRVGQPDSAGFIVQNNTVYNNGVWGSAVRVGKGIWITGVNGVVSHVRYNKVYHNNMFGIGGDGPNLGQIHYYYNIIYGQSSQDATCFREGIGIAYSFTEMAVYNNICYGNYIGICLEGDALLSGPNLVVNNLVKNNICTGNITSALEARYGAENDGTYGSGNVYLNNCFGAEATNFVEWGNGVFKATYAAWETAYGGTTASVQVDPKFVNAAAYDFRLLLNSPCRGKGTNVSLTLDYAGNTVPAWTGKVPDIGCYENRPNGVIWEPKPRPTIH